MSESGMSGLLRSSAVIGRRDFAAVVFSKTFLLFLVGPLFLVLIMAVAVMLGMKAGADRTPPVIGIAMQAEEVAAFQAAYRPYAAQMPKRTPQLIVLAKLKPGESFNANAALTGQTASPSAGQNAKKPTPNAVITGSLQAPVLTGVSSDIERWQGLVSLVSGQAVSGSSITPAKVQMQPVANTAADDQSGRSLTGSTAQSTLMFLTMLLAGMVLSNLVEEKSNKILEVLAAAVPIESVFFGKLFAMLSMALLGISVWIATGMGLALIVGISIPAMAPPAVGWPVFFLLCLIYFAMAYLLQGSIFLGIGAMATTVRQVQTLSMPVTMLQVLVFVFAGAVVSRPGSALELVGAIFPLSSPFVMIAHAAREPEIWPHLLAIGWQAICVALFVRTGARVFKRNVMKSGKPREKKQRLAHSQ